MSKRLNVFMLIILLVGQTIIGPIGSISATGIDEANITENSGTPDEQAGGEIKGDKEPSVIDKDDLRNFLEVAKNYAENDYTADSFGAFVEAITAGQNVLEDNDATEEDVNEAVDAIQDAIGALEAKKPEDADEDDEANVIVETSSNSGDKETSTKKSSGEKSIKEQESSADGESEPITRSSKEEFRVNISEITDQNGNPFSKDNPLGIDDEFTVELDWHLINNHNYKPGDIETIELPKEIYIPEMLEGELKDDKTGDVIANYTVNTDGTVTLEFTEFVNNASDVTGWIKIFAKLDQDEVENDGGKVKISPIDGEGGITLPIDQSQIEKTTEKQGEPNRSYNADEIEWTVTINKNALFLEEATVTDLLPEGTEYIEGSLAIEKYPASLNGRPTGEREAVTGVTPELDGQSLSIPLGDINEVYVIKYKTKVTDLEKKHFNNKVSLTDKELKDTSAHATVTINRGEPLKKGIAENYDPKTGIITWYLEFNYDQKDLENITLEDNWTPEGKVELVDGSVSFQRVEIDEDGKAHPVGEAIDPSELGNLKKEENGFKIEGITTDQPYKVTYQTKVIEREIEGFDLDNIASFENNEDGKGVHIGQHVGAKSAGQINYADKTIEWTIRVNMDQRPMKDVVIEDSLGDGLILIEDSIYMTIGGTPYTDFELEAGNPFTLSNIGDTDQEIIVTYKTTYDPNKLPADNQAHNKADIFWTPENSDERIKRDVKANKPVNQETIEQSWKNASYNPDTKEITYEIIANYRENSYENFKIVDEPQQNQKLVEDSIEIYALKIDKDGNYKEDGNQLDIEPSITDNAFTLNIGETDRAYKITYKTSLEGLDDIYQVYENKALVLNGDEELAELDASVKVYGDTKYGHKTGKQQGKKINWSVEVNNAQQVIDNLVFKDMIDPDNQEYLADTIKVYEATVNKDDGRLNKGDKLDPANYELTVEEDHFTIAWKDQVDRGFIVEYATIFFAGDREEVTNNYKITGDSIEEDAEDAESGASVQVRQSDAGGSGQSGYLIVEKLDTTYGQDVNPLEGITFQVIDQETQEVLKTETTDADGYAEFGRLLFGDYILKEVNPPKGYIGFGEQVIEINEPYDPSAEKQYTFEVENYKPNYDVELFKVDENGKALEGAEFALFTREAQEVDRQTTDAEGKIVFKDLDVGHYYVQETKAPTGYVLDDTKHNLEIVENQQEAVKIEASNERKKVDVSVEKVWKGSTEDAVTINLLANGEKLDDVELSDSNDWKHTFTDLFEYDDQGEKIKYTVEEVQVEGYTTEITGDADNGFTVTNVRTGHIDLPIEKVWEDKDDQHELRPDHIDLQLLANGETKETVKLSEQNDWQHVFENLEQYDKEGEKITYTVEEVAVDEYRTSIKGSQEEGFTVTNTLKTYAIGDYVWVDRNKDGIQDEEEEPLEGVKVELYDKDGNKLAETETDEAGRYLFDELPAGEYNVKFTLTEKQKEIYRFTKEQSGDDTTVDSDADGETGWTREIVLNDENEYLWKDYDRDFKATEGIDPTWDAGVVELVQISVKKVWEDRENKHQLRPDNITVKLLANKTKKDTTELSEENDWQYTFKKLDKYDDHGEIIEYTVEEVEVAEYVTEITGDAEKGYTITNTVKDYAIGDYVWVDRNKDGIQDDNEEPLEGVKVELYDEDGEKIAETETDENGRYIFDELPAGEYKVKFTLTEEQAKKYRFTKEQTGNDITVDSDANPENGWTREIVLNDENDYLTHEYNHQDFKATQGIDPTWDAGVIELVQVTGVKVWKDSDDKNELRPENIIIELYANDEKVDEQKVSADWNFEFKDLDQYDENGEEINYTIKEQAVDNYTTEIKSTEDGFVVTNTLKTYAIGDYVWVDRNKDGIQDDNEEPLEGVKVELYDKDGNKIAETETDENGRYIFDELPAGEYKVKFTLTEEQAKKYRFTKEQTGSDITVDSDANPENGWTRKIVLNDENDYLTHEYNHQDFKATQGIDPTWDAGIIELVQVSGVKTWIGDNAENRPESITVKLYANGGEIAELEVAGPEWTFAFVGLDKYDENGGEIVYTVDEVAVDGYKTTIDGYNITNTYIPVDPEKPSKDTPEDPKGDKDKGSALPKTATNMYALIVLGMALVALGVTFHLTRRRKKA